MRIEDIMRISKISDKSDTYKALRGLEKAGLLKKCENTPYRILQYEFLLHIPKR